MFPLKNRQLIRGCAAHVKAGLGCAADYEARYITDYVPFDGVLENYWGKEGGNWCRLTRPNGDRIEMAHHSKFLLKNGPAKEGQSMAVTGNTGAITTRPHLHIQIFNKAGKRLDPEKYNWNSKPMAIPFQVTLITTQSWTQPQVDEARQIILDASDNRLDVQVTAIQKQFSQIPFAQYDYKRVEENWYRQNVIPLGTNPMLHMSVAEWQSDNQGYNNPDGIQFRADEREAIYFSQSGIIIKAFPQNFVHELCHRLFMRTGQPDPTHQFMYPPLGIWNPKGAYSQLDHSKLTQPNMAKIYKVNDHGKLGVMIVEGFSGTILFENDFTEYQTLLKITNAQDAPTITLP